MHGQALWEATQSLTVHTLCDDAYNKTREAFKGHTKISWCKRRILDGMVSLLPVYFPSQKHNTGKHKVVFLFEKHTSSLSEEPLYLMRRVVFDFNERQHKNLSAACWCQYTRKVFEKSEIQGRINDYLRFSSSAPSSFLPSWHLCNPQEYSAQGVIRYEGMSPLETRLRHGLHHFRDYVSSSPCSVKRGRSKLPTPWYLRKHVESRLDPASAQSDLK